MANLIWLTKAGPSRILAANAVYDSSALPASLLDRGTTPVIPSHLTHRRLSALDGTLYRRCNIIERSLLRL